MSGDKDCSNPRGSTYNPKQASVDTLYRFLIDRDDFPIVSDYIGISPERRIKGVELRIQSFMQAWGADEQATTVTWASPAPCAYTTPSDMRRLKGPASPKDLHW